mmetsp:Transcript_41209/g.116600  ORF Transcript_41209/g.116600 Transcript_41209/m.116600 type:complete len:357 (-) Transcript_41209:859-1929(-)
MVGQQAVAEVQGRAHRFLRLRAEVPRPMGRLVLDGVHAHEGHEHARLHPARQQLARGLPPEAADVAGDVGRAGHHPVQHRARHGLEVLPRRLVVAHRGRGAQPRHAGDEAPVQGEEALLGGRGLERRRLRDVPVPIGVVLHLALHVDPEVYAVLGEVLHLLGVPVADLGLGEVQVAPSAVLRGVVVVGVDAALEEPALGAELVEGLLGADAGPASPGDLHVVVLLERRELRLRVAEDVRVVAEVGEAGLALAVEENVEGLREPLCVDGDVVDGHILVAEVPEHLLDVVEVLPAPARGTEAEHVPRRDRRPADELVVEARGLRHVGLRDEVKGKGVALVGPCDFLAVRLVGLLHHWP